MKKRMISAAVAAEIEIAAMVLRTQKHLRRCARKLRSGVALSLRTTIDVALTEV